MRPFAFSIAIAAPVVLNLIGAPVEAAPLAVTKIVLRPEPPTVEKIFFLRRLGCELGGYRCRYYRNPWYR